MKIPSKNTSGYLGVSKISGKEKWLVQINVNKSHVRIGTFNTVEEAGQAYIDYCIKNNLEDRLKEGDRNKYLREYNKNNKERIKERNKKYTVRYNSKATKKRHALRDEILKAYNNICECCGEIEPDFLTIDHIDGNGNEHKKEIGSSLYRWLKANGFPKDNFR